MAERDALQETGAQRDALRGEVAVLQVRLNDDRVSLE